MGNEKLLVVLNFSKDNVVWNDEGYKNAAKALLISNYSDTSLKTGFNLRPYEAAIYRLQ